MKRVVCYSGGHSSAIVDIEVARKYPDDEIIVYEVLDEMGAKTFTEQNPCSYIRHATPVEIKAGRRL